MYNSDYNEYDHFYDNYKEENYENDEIDSKLSIKTIKDKNKNDIYYMEKLFNIPKAGFTGLTGLTGLTSLNQKQEDIQKKEDLIFINSTNLNKINYEYPPNENNQKINDTISTNKRKLGRKNKNSNEIGEHNKYSEDNLIRKIKSNILSYLFDFINSFISKIYVNVGKGVFKKELKKISQRQILDTNRNKLFLNSTLEEIFSDDISRKYNNYPSQHNRNLIQKLINEEDEDKREKFKNLFSLTFLDCLMHIRGDKYFQELDGLETYDNIFKKFSNDKEYYDLLNNYIFNFEKIIMRKRLRKKRKMK